MANVEPTRDEAEEAALARLLDPVALEARLAVARARRAAVLAARLAARTEAKALPQPPNLPGLALRGAAVILSGLAIVVAAASFLLGGAGQAPDVALFAAAPSPPGAVPAVQRPGAPHGWGISSPAAPRLAGLVFAPAAAPGEAAPPSRPVRTAAAAVAPSKTRAATAMASTAPVLGRAFASTPQPMVSRSAALLPYPLVQDDRSGSPRAAPKVVRRPPGLLQQIARASRSAVRGVTRSDPGEGVARTIRRATAALRDDGPGGKSRGNASPTPRGSSAARADNGRGHEAGKDKDKGGKGERASGRSGGPKGASGNKDRGGNGKGERASGRSGGPKGASGNKDRGGKGKGGSKGGDKGRKH